MLLTLRQPAEREIGIEALTELALDLRWSWHHATDELWAELEPELWALTHNPWVVLQTASRTRLASAAGATGVPEARREAARRNGASTWARRPGSSRPTRNRR